MPMLHDNDALIKMLAAKNSKFKVQQAISERAKVHLNPINLDLICVDMPIPMFIANAFAELSNRPCQVGIFRMQPSAELQQILNKTLDSTYSGGPSKCFFELGRRMKFII
ncbi:Hypothetical_protein [Hexamita inflata]|uniref:Hypothetical_protein n=1 Tax=Hexamita inflata TaxID=28002 RepID=A0ABP1KPU3_9EUKA